MAQLLQTIKQRFFDANGEPLAGGKLYSYDAGTSSPRNTYNDQSGGVANANPTILDSSGYADIWLDTGSYKFVLKDSNDVTQFTVDNVSIFGAGTVTTSTLADGAVTSVKIADSEVKTVNILDNAVTTAKINDDAVTTAKIADANVTNAKMATDSVNTTQIVDGAVTQAKRASLGQQISSSCGSWSNATATVTAVTNLSVNITTTGRPVFIGLIGVPSVQSSIQNDTGIGATVYFYRDSTEIVSCNFGAGIFIPPSAYWYIDVPSSGTYTYTTKAVRNGNGSVYFENIKMVAFEL